MFAEITNTYLLRPPLPYYYYHVKQFNRISFSWNSNSFPKHPFNLPPLTTSLPFLIKAAAAATVEPKCNDVAIAGATVEPKCNDVAIAGATVEPICDDVEIAGGPVPDEKEKLRRLRISKANKGNTPWNKGRKHTPETLQKIKERTRIAMQNPKIKRKLINLGRVQTAETKLKIGTRVRNVWEKKRQIKMLQEICYFQWQNLIAQASRQGFIGQEELQWDSYETLNQQLKQEWLANAEQRKLMPRPPSNNRAPKSLEQRKKIGQAISAKWADPEYRERVVSAIAKYYQSTGTVRKPRARPSYSGQTPKKKKPITKKISVKSSSKIIKPINLRKRKPPAYKDPLVNSKLDMIKNIRAQRASVDTRQTQAIQQARLLIAEAEKAAKALEVAAEKSPVAKASLIETRKLIAEAIQSLESIDTQKTEDCNVPSDNLSEEVNKENESTFEVGNLSQMIHVNGHTTLSSSGSSKYSEDFGYLSLERPVNGDPELLLTNGCSSLPFGLISQMIKHSPSNQESGENETDDSPAEDETLPRSASPTEDETLSRSESPAEDETLSISDFPAEDETLSRSDSPTEDETLSRSDSPAEDETLPRSPIATKKWVRGRLVEVNEEQQ